jgi:DNA end-binding protein Ku
MALPKPFWKGFLKLSLVTCPVAMTPALSQSEKVKFHTLNRETGNRVESRYIDDATGETVDKDDQVLGYERGENEYVLLEKEELESVALESVRTIDIDMFAAKESIEWIWYDKPHYLTPDGPVGEEAFAVIREAMAATGTVGIARLVLGNREHAVMLEPRDRGIVLWTLRYGNEVRDPKAYFGDIRDEKLDPALQTLMAQLIGEKKKHWSPSMVHDPVQERLKEIIAAKEKHQQPPKPRGEAERPHNVVNIHDALKKSLAAESKRAKKG